MSTLRAVVEAPNFSIVTKTILIVLTLPRPQSVRTRWQPRTDEPRRHPGGTLFHSLESGRRVFFMSFTEHENSISQGCGGGLTPEIDASRCVDYRKYQNVRKIVETCCFHEFVIDSTLKLTT